MKQNKRSKGIFQKFFVDFHGAIFIIVAYFILRSVQQIFTHSVTVDEPIHILSGYEWLSTGYSPSDPFSPPFAKIALGLLMLFKLPVTDPYLFLPRIVSVIIISIFICYFYFWVKRYFSPIVATLATLFLVVEPSFIGYTHLATTESLTMLAFFLVVSTCINFINCTKSRKRSLFFFLCALIVLYFTKTVFLPAFLLLLPFFYKKITVKPVLLASGVFILLLLLLSGFHSYELLGKFQILGGGIFASTFSGLSYVVNPKFIATRQIVFMDGVSQTGSYFYTITSLILKTSPHLILLSIGGIVLFFIKKYGSYSTIIKILLIVIVSTIVLVTLGKYNVGIRHLLPIFPLLAILAAVFVEKVAKTKMLTVILGICIFVSACISSATPDTIAYFTPFVGGERGGRIIGDSNIDWGQSLPILAKENKKIDYILASSPVIPSVYGINAKILPPLTSLSKELLTGKTVYIARTQYYKQGFYKSTLFPQNKAYAANNTFVVFQF